MKTIYIPFSFFAFLTLFSTNIQGQDCEATIAFSPEVPGNIYCPNDNIFLTVSEGYDIYTWYYNFTNSNIGGTQFSSGDWNELVINVVDWGYVYFYVEVANDTCEAVTDPIVMDSWVFLSPVIESSGQAEYCQGDSTEISYPFGGSASYQWFKDGLPIPGAIQQSYWVKESGTYTLTVSYIECPNFYQSSGVGPTFTFTQPIIPDIINDQGELFVSSGTVIQWYLDGEPIEGETMSSYSPQHPGGAYYAEVEDENGCLAISETLKLYFVDATDDYETETKIRIAPNPGDGVFNIQSGQDIEKLYVYDARGILIHSIKDVNQPAFQLDLLNFAPGNYWIRFEFSNGKTAFLPLMKQ